MHWKCSSGWLDTWSNENRSCIEMLRHSGQWLSFNKNKSCIEIIKTRAIDHRKKEFNKNKSCIEINLYKVSLNPAYLFNKNKSCIEIFVNCLAVYMLEV